MSALAGIPNALPARKKGIFNRAMDKYEAAMSLHANGFEITQTDINKEEKEAKELTLLGGGTLGLLSLCGGAMVGNGLTLAVLTAAGFGMLVIKMPKWFRHLCVEFDTEIDVVMTFAMLAMYGTTVTGLIASGMTCILISMCLKWNRWAVYKDLVNGKAN